MCCTRLAPVPIRPPNVTPLKTDPQPQCALPARYLARLGRLVSVEHNASWAADVEALARRSFPAEDLARRWDLRVLPPSPAEVCAANCRGCTGCLAAGPALSGPASRAVEEGGEVLLLSVAPACLGRNGGCPATLAAAGAAHTVLQPQHAQMGTPAHLHRLSFLEGG